jgi:glycosyltransferase involved in cell wall biosynthesis
VSHDQGGGALGRTRVLTIADHLGAMGGAEIAQVSVMEGLAAAGWTVDLLYVTRGDLWPRWDALAARTRAVRSSQLQREAPLGSAWGSLGAFTDLMRTSTDVVYLHNPGDLPVAWSAARLKRVPVVLHLHLPPPIHQPAWLNRLIARADGVIVPSADAARRWIREAGLANHQVSVIPTGVDTGRFVPFTDSERMGQRRALGIDPAVPILLYAGRLNPTKGLSVLFESVHKMEEPVTLLVCGSGVDAAYADGLRRESHGLDVTWLDRRVDVAPLMAAADLLVLPSEVPETQGMVVSEAMACGTPAVATAVGGLPETLSGFPDHLVPPGDAMALAGVVDHLIQWRRHTPSLGSDSRQWVLDHLDLDRTVGEVSALLGGLDR